MLLHDRVFSVTRFSHSDIANMCLFLRCVDFLALTKVNLFTSRIPNVFLLNMNCIVKGLKCLCMKMIAFVCDFPEDKPHVIVWCNSYIPNTI